MQWPIQVQGRLIERSEVDWIKQSMRENPHMGRTPLSVKVCERWDWRRSDGQLKDIACRELLRKLEKLELLRLPPRQTGGGSCKAPQIATVPVDDSPICCTLKQLGVLKMVNVDDSANINDKGLFNYLLKQYHYLGFVRPVGQNMKYLIYSSHGRVLGCLLFGAAAWKTQGRDTYIGWSPQQREKHLGLLTNNTRFLILPWVNVKHLASCVLAMCLRCLNRDWMQKYGSELALVETFVDTERFKGTCYRASNWLFVGQTKGRSRQDRYGCKKVPIKDTYVYPLEKDFRKLLCD